MICEKNGVSAARGLLAALLDLGPEECTAIRRHAARLELRGDLDGALDAFRVATLLDPEQPAGWRGLERVLRARGEDWAATGAMHLADLLEAKRRGEPWRPRKGGGAR